MNLPKFTELQQKIVIRKLIEMDSPRVIAKYLQNTFPEFVPDGMDQKEYEQAVISRCKDYVSNKGRKWFAIIQEGRQKFKGEMIRWVSKELLRIGFVADSYKHRHAFDSCDMKQVKEIADMMWELRDKIYTQIYGESEYIGYMDPQKVGVGLRRARMTDSQLELRRRVIKASEIDIDALMRDDTDTEENDRPLAVPTADSEHLINE